MCLLNSIFFSVPSRANIFVVQDIDIVSVSQHKLGRGNRDKVQQFMVITGAR